MRGIMRTSSLWDREHEALRRQNEQITAELTKLKETNSILRRKNHMLSMSLLNLSIKRDVAVQTELDEFVSDEKDESMFSLSEVITTSKRISKVVTPEKVEYNPMLKESTEFNTSLNFSSEEVLEFESLVISADSNEKISPNMRHPRTKSAKSPRLALSPRMLKSPIHKRVQATISERIVKALFPTAGRSPLRSPASPYSSSGSDSSPKIDVGSAYSAASATTTVQVDRTPRKIRKPVSYKEPSLRVKVRKGFRFVHFKEVPVVQEHSEHDDGDV